MFILDFGGLVSEVVCGSGTITAPYDDVAEVYCYSGIRAWALVSLSTTLFSCLLFFSFVAFIFMSSSFSFPIAGELCHLVLFLLSAPESLLVLTIDAAVTWKAELLT